MLILCTPTIAEKPNFNIANLGYIPGYERYEFVGKGTSIDTLPVVIEYHAHRKRRPKARWDVSGSIKLKNTLVEEKYKILFKNLLITHCKRVQSFKRGTLKAVTDLDVNVETHDPDEFIIGTIPGLMYVLRTYPFESDVKEIRVRAPQQTKGHLNLKVRNKGKKKLDTKSFGTIEAYHLEVSLMVPVLGAVLPKLNYYFRDDRQKTLVQMKGFMPATGKKLNVELNDYTIKKKSTETQPGE
jgi:hypothetical protein